MEFPPKYLENLSPQQRILQATLLRKSQKEYEKTGLVKDRPKVSNKDTPRSPHVKKFEKKYGFPVTDLSKVKKLFPDTDVETILDKGAGAYASSGSRPNVGSFQWKFARLASVLTGGKAYKVDEDLVGSKSKQIIFS